MRQLAHIFLLADIFSMKVFVWALGSVLGWPLGSSGELLDSHLFFFDRYSELADYHRSQGRIAKADRLAAIAEAHYQAAPGAPEDDPPPEAAAMAMPVPRTPIDTNAVSTRQLPSRSGRSSRRRYQGDRLQSGRQASRRSRPAGPSHP